MVSEVEPSKDQIPKQENMDKKSFILFLAAAGIILFAIFLVPKLQPVQSPQLTPTEQKLQSAMLVIDYDAARKLEVLTKAGAVRSRYGAWLEDADGQPLHDPEKLKTYISTELGDIFVAASEI